MDPLFVAMLDNAREIAGVPFVITSGWRCEKHNAELKGAARNSWHMRGCAADIAAASSDLRYSVVTSLLSVGFCYLGIGDTFVHVQLKSGIITPRIWLYPR